MLISLSDTCLVFIMFLNTWKRRTIISTKFGRELGYQIWRAIRKCHLWNTTRYDGWLWRGFSYIYKLNFIRPVHFQNEEMFVCVCVYVKHSFEGQWVPLCSIDQMSRWVLWKEVLNSWKLEFTQEIPLAF